MSKYGLPSAIKEIEIHVGHWKIGTGASRIVDEVRESRKIAKRVYDVLKAHNVPATYFQDDTSTNKDQNLKTLVAHHNQDTNGLVVSFHLNSTGGTVQDGIGTEVLYANPSWQKLSADLSKAIATAGNFKNRGAKLNKGLYVLNSTKEPAVLIETFFVNSHADVTMYNRHFEEICFAIAEVLASAIGHTLKKEEEKSDEKPSTWAEEAIEWAIENKISDGSKPKKAATREEVIAMLYRFSKLK